MSTAQAKMEAATEHARKEDEKKRQRAAQRDARLAMPLTVLTPAECALDEARPYVIKGILARGDVAGAIGPPGSGKSALIPLAGYFVALGEQFLGRRVRQGPVLYFAAEDGCGMKMRVRALHLRHGDAPDFKLIPDTLDLYEDEGGDVSKVCVLIREYRPVLVIIDTIARAFPGLRENDSESMGRVVTVLRIFANEQCQPAVIGMHHVAKDAGTTPRGHGVLHGDLDVVLFIEGQKAEVRNVSMTKNRNGPSDPTFAFNIETEDFGPDEDGDPTTAPIAAPIDGPAPTLKAGLEAKLADKPKLMLRELRDLIDRCGTMVVPGGDHPLVRAVPRFELRNRLIDRSWFAESVLCKGATGKVEMDRKAYPLENNALSTLKAKGFASFNRNHVWLL